MKKIFNTVIEFILSKLTVPADKLGHFSIGVTISAIFLLSKLTVPADKLGYFSVGVTIFAILHLCIFNTWALLIVIIIAALKELYDYLHPKIHTCDIWDFVATTLGGVIGFICTLKA